MTRKVAGTNNNPIGCEQYKVPQIHEPSRQVESELSRHREFPLESFSLLGVSQLVEVLPEVVASTMTMTTDSHVALIWFMFKFVVIVVCHRRSLRFKLESGPSSSSGLSLLQCENSILPPLV